MPARLPDEAQQRLDALPDRPHVVTVGNFDGIHKGHQYLLDLLKQRGTDHGARTLVVTFEPHPISVLRPGAGFLRLTPPASKLELLRQCGIDEVVVIPFTHEFSKVEARDFLQAIASAAQPKAIVVGEGFKFGYRRAGDGSTIKGFAEENGFEAHVLPRLADGETVISSSFVRTSLLTGELDDAHDALGRRYRLFGNVVRGMSRGKDLGYPTANLALDEELLVPAAGIYACYVHLTDRGPEPGMLYIGTSPTFDPRGQTVEVHILDFDKELYGDDLEIELVAFTRGDMEFESVDALVEQMQADEREIRDILRREQPEQPTGVVR